MSRIEDSSIAIVVMLIGLTIAAVAEAKEDRVSRRSGKRSGLSPVSHFALATFGFGAGSADWLLRHNGTVAHSLVVGFVVAAIFVVAARIGKSRR